MTKKKSAEENFFWGTGRGHTYPPRIGIDPIVVTVAPGIVFWDGTRNGWSFNVLIDTVAVRVSAVWMRASEAKEAMADEVKRLRDAMVTPMERV